MSGINLQNLMRDLKCLSCKIEYKSNEPNPICPYCGGRAVKIVKSVLTSYKDKG